MSTILKGSKSQPNAGNSESTMFGGPWGRLLWKDTREIFLLWITLTIAAVLCLVVTFWMVSDPLAHIAPLYISGHTFIGLCSVITGVFLLANENENRTLHLLRNLPLRPNQIIWEKLFLGGVGVVLIACLVAVLTVLLATFADCNPLVSHSSYRFTVANVTLLPLLYLTIACLAAMFSRSLLYGVVIAGLVSVGLIWILQPTWLGAREYSASNQRSEIRWMWVTLAIFSGVATLVLNVGHWVEEKTGKQKSKRSRSLRSSPLGSSSDENLFPADAPTISTVAVLMWQSFRQTRIPLIACLTLIIVGWLVIAAGVAYHQQQIVARSIMTCVMASLWMLAMTTVFSTTIFFDDKRKSNFLFFQQNRERGRWFWMSRLVPFFVLSAAIVLALKFCILDTLTLFGNFDAFWFQDYSPSFDRRSVEGAVSVRTQVASQSFLIPMLSMLGVVGIGQYFSMFIRNPILCFVFSCVVSAVFLAVTGYVVFVNENVWWTLVPIVAACYLATWWRSRSWLATSPRSTDFILPLAVPPLVCAVIAALFAHHRATEFDDLAVKPSEYSTWLSKDTFIGDFRPKFGTESQALEAADLYQDAVNLFKGKYTPDTTSDQPMPWPEQKTSAYVSQNKLAIAKIIAAAEIPVCAPFLSPASDNRDRQVFLLGEMALANAHYQLLKGHLPAAKDAIDAYDRVLQRTNTGSAISRVCSGYYGLLVQWADHPDQTSDSIKSAIAQLEGARCDLQTISTDVQTSPKQQNETWPKIAVSYWEFGGEQFFMNLQYEIQDLKTQRANYSQGQTRLRDGGFWLLPWEYQRWVKVSQRRALRIFQRQTLSLAFSGLDNDRPIHANKFLKHYRYDHQEAKIPVAEDRLGGHLWWYRFGFSEKRIDEINWRRYALLRLGLAVFKIENGDYPQDLAELRSYFSKGLPILTTGQMFGWYQNGLQHDLVYVDYEDEESGTIRSSTKLLEGGLPVLLPFAINPTMTMPFAIPVEYQAGKFGIEKEKLSWGRVYDPFGTVYTRRYPLPLNVGVNNDDSSSAEAQTN